MTLLRHLDNLGTARFVTFSCYRRFPLFNRKEAALTFLAELHRWREKSGIRILGYVLMPEHVHLVLWPKVEARLGIELGICKGRASRIILAGWPGGPPKELLVDGNTRSYSAFQCRCYDHNCRTVETVREKIIYCHNNPVRRGLVVDPSEWRWSSYGWYEGRFDGPLEIDMVELGLLESTC